MGANPFVHITFMICNQCNEEFNRLCGHWYASSQCDYPSFSRKENEIITGLLMGDACVDNSTKNPYLVVNMTNKPFLMHLDSLFGNKSTVCDGTYDTSGHHDRISISASNEIGNKDKINKYFIEAGIPEPSNWNITERSSGGFRCNIYWTNKYTDKLFDYIGSSLPGFEYKWDQNI